MDRDYHTPDEPYYNLEFFKEPPAAQVFEEGQQRQFIADYEAVQWNIQRHFVVSKEEPHEVDSKSEATDDDPQPDMSMTMSTSLMTDSSMLSTTSVEEATINPRVFSWGNQDWPFFIPDGPTLTDLGLDIPESYRRIIAFAFNEPDNTNKSVITVRPIDEKPEHTYNTPHCSAYRRDEPFRIEISCIYEEKPLSGRKPRTCITLGDYRRLARFLARTAIKISDISERNLTKIVDGVLRTSTNGTRYKTERLKRDEPFKTQIRAYHCPRTYNSNNEYELIHWSDLTGLLRALRTRLTLEQPRDTEERANESIDCSEPSPVYTNTDSSIP